MKGISYKIENATLKKLLCAPANNYISARSKHVAITKLFAYTIEKLMTNQSFTLPISSTEHYIHIVIPP